MGKAIHTMTFPGPLLSRGFWLYVWTIKAPDRTVLYVGRTGDSARARAASPFERMGQHLGWNKNQNMLRQNLEKCGISPESCQWFNLIACGPVFPEMRDDKTAHYPLRDKVAAMERDLAEALKAAGYIVLNEVKSRKTTDPDLWADVREAFAPHFPGLK